MNIGQLIQTLIATIVGSIIGGLIVIATNLIKEGEERRKDTQKKYEQTYVIEGIDPLVAYYQSLAFILINKANNHTISIVEKDIPVEALSKVRILTKNIEPLNIVLMAHGHLANTEDKDILTSASASMQNAVEALLDYRVKLTAKILISTNSLDHKRETAELIHRLYDIDNKLISLEDQRGRQQTLEERDEFLPKPKVMQSYSPEPIEKLSQPHTLEKRRKVRKDRFPRI